MLYNDFFHAPASLSLMDLVLRMGYNALIIFVLTFLIYYRRTRRKDYLFTFLLIGNMVFVLSYLLGNTAFQIGMALGLFAVFGIIRYRTGTMPIRETTYLFLTIGLSLSHALAPRTHMWAVFAIVDAITLLVTYLLEHERFLPHRASVSVMYDKLENIRPENRSTLVADLKARTGLNVEKIEIGNIDLLRERVRLKVFYYTLERIADQEAEPADD